MPDFNSIMPMRSGIGGDILLAQKELLWSNSQSSFSAQEITLAKDVDEFSLIEVDFQDNLTAMYKTLHVFISPRELTYNFSTDPLRYSAVWKHTNGKTYIRHAYPTSDNSKNKIMISQAYQLNTTTAANTMLVPIAVYGIY